MLEEQTVSINFGQGIDSKTDSKLVIPGKLTRLENAVIDKAKRLSKRKGYSLLPMQTTSGGTITSPKLVKSYLNELLCADGDRLYSYSTELSKWVDKGKYVSIAVTNENIFAAQGTDNFQSSAILGNYVLYAYVVGGSTYISVLDLNTKTFIATNLSAGVPATHIRCVTLGASAFAVVYANTPTLDLVCRVITVSGSGVSVGSENVLGSNVALDTTTHATREQFDVVNTTSGATVAYASAASAGGVPTGIKIVNVSTSGTAGTSVSIAGAGMPYPLSLARGSDGKIWVYWVDHTTPNASTLYYAIYNSSLSSVLSKTTITSGLTYVSQIAANPTSTTGQTVYYSVQDQYWDQSTTLPRVHTEYITITSAGVIGSPTTFLYHVDLSTKPFTVGSKTYMGLNFRSLSQATGFVVDLADSKIVAKFLPGRYQGIYQSKGYLAEVMAISSTKVSITCGYQTQALPFAFGVNGDYGVMSVGLDFSHADAYAGLEAGNTVILNGGIVQSYDGDCVNELNFHYAPDFILATPSATGGTMANGTYAYYALYRWIDLQGNLHRSATTSVNVTVTGAGGNYDAGTLGTGSVVIDVQTLGITSKPFSGTSVVIEIYRTDPNQTTPRLVRSIGNLTGTASISFTDDFFTVTGNLPIYIEGDVVDNYAPPASMIMALIQNRVWMVESESPVTNVWYSKALSSLIGVSMSQEFVESIPMSYGEIRGLAGLDDKTVFLKEKGIIFFGGNPGNDLGLGSTLSQPNLVPSDTGCSTPKSVISYPGGILFKTPKGIYQFDRGTNTTYFGIEAEGYNSQDITAATLLYDKNQIRFLTSSGNSLVFDYLFNQWSTFTNHAGYSADVWNGTYVYTRTDGAIYKEDSSSYLDNATSYRLLAQTAWLKLSAVQGFQRVRRFGMLGDFETASGHGIRVSAAYDFGTTFDTPVSYSFTGSNGAFQYRERLPRQKCDAIQFLIEEVTTGASGEFIDLTDMTFEAGIKKGINKLPAGQSNG